MPVKRDSELCPQGLCKSPGDLIHSFIHSSDILSVLFITVLPVRCMLPGSQ